LANNDKAPVTVGDRTAQVKKIGVLREDIDDYDMTGYIQKRVGSQCNGAISLYHERAFKVDSF